MLYMSFLYCMVCMGRGRPVDGYGAGMGVEDPYSEDDEQVWPLAVGRGYHVPTD